MNPLHDVIFKFKSIPIQYLNWSTDVQIQSTPRATTFAGMVLTLANLTILTIDNPCRPVRWARQTLSQRTNIHFLYHIYLIKWIGIESVSKNCQWREQLCSQWHLKEAMCYVTAMSHERLSIGGQCSGLRVWLLVMGHLLLPSMIICSSCQDHITISTKIPVVRFSWWLNLCSLPLITQYMDSNKIKPQMILNRYLN
jgi:hypothetical protein